MHLLDQQKPSTFLNLNNYKLTKKTQLLRRVFEVNRGCPFPYFQNSGDEM